MSVRFQAAWCATDLGDYRPCHSTYQWYPYHSLPPLDDTRFTGSYEWRGNPGSVMPEASARLDGLRQALSEDCVI